MENNDKFKEDKNKLNVTSDFVTSYFAWVELDEQKKIVDKLENVTEKQNKK